MIGTIDSHFTGEPLERIGELSKTTAHWMLVQMGKRVLRPGGIVFTRQMLSALQRSPDDRVVEFAPGMGASARLTL